MNRFWRIRWWWNQNAYKYHLTVFELEKIFKVKRCSCGHPLWCHQCYEHGTCKHGSCLASTFLDEECYCEGFNSMWNEDYPPNIPRITKTQDGSVDE